MLYQRLHIFAEKHAVLGNKGVIILRHNKACQVVAFAKRTFPNILYAATKSYLVQVITIQECTITNTRNAVGNTHVCQTGAAAKRTCSNMLHAAAKSDSSQVFTISKCIAANAGFHRIYHNKCDLLPVLIPRRRRGRREIHHLTTAGDSQRAIGGQLPCQQFKETARAGRNYLQLKRCRNSGVLGHCKRVNSVSNFHGLAVHRKSFQLITLVGSHSHGNFRTFCHIAYMVSRHSAVLGFLNRHTVVDGILLKHRTHDNAFCLGYSKYERIKRFLLIGQEVTGIVHFFAIDQQTFDPVAIVHRHLCIDGFPGKSVLLVDAHSAAGGLFHRNGDQAAQHRICQRSIVCTYRHAAPLCRHTLVVHRAHAAVVKGVAAHCL